MKSPGSKLGFELWVYEWTSKGPSKILHKQTLYACACDDCALIVFLKFSAFYEALTSSGLIHK